MIVQCYPVLVSGGRDYADRAKVFACLDTLLFFYGDLMVVTGACPRGADLFAEQWAKSRQQVYVGFPAQWDRYQKRAGMLRNSEMAALSEVKQAVVFQGGRGTLNMLSLARDTEIMGDILIWLPDGEFWK